MRRPAALVVLGLLLTTVVATAQQPSVEVHLEPKRFGLEDHTRLTISVTGGEQVSVPSLDELDNLQVVSGPSTRRSFSWINGEASSETSFTWLLQAQDVGEVEVGAVTVQVGGHTVIAAPVQGEAVPGSVAPPRRSPRQLRRDTMSDLVAQTPRREPVVQLRTLVDRRRVVVGETVTVSVVLDTNTRIEGFEWTTAPVYPGWWTQAMDSPEEIAAEEVEVEGRRLYRYTIKQVVAIPLEVGSLTIPAASAKLGTRSRSLFSPARVLERATRPVSVDVVERPAAPVGFAGAVGKLRYSADVSPATVELGEPVTVEIVLEGEGNLPLVSPPPQWPTCADCETYEPVESSDFRVIGGEVRGRRSWKLAMMPRSAGPLELEPVELATYDADAEQYRVHSLGPLSVMVEGPPPTPAPEEVAPGTAAESPTESAMPAGVPLWAVAVALVGGILLGAVAVALVLRRRQGIDLPPAKAGETPSERARVLQGALEAWWHRTADDAPPTLKASVEGLRRDLESVRFAPGRADHSETVADLESRLRSLLG